MIDKLAKKLFILAEHLDVCLTICTHGQAFTANHIDKSHTFIYEAVFCVEAITPINLDLFWLICTSNVKIWI